MESDDYVKYTEDIYVGYRYFETIPGAAHKVIYGFGYGLSYTSFAISAVRQENQEPPSQSAALSPIPEKPLARK